MTNDNLWIYIERTRTRGKFMIKLGRNYLLKNNVLVLNLINMELLKKRNFIIKKK